MNQAEATGSDWRTWSDAEVRLLRRRFANTSNKELGVLFGRSAKSVSTRGNLLGLTKSHQHRSEESRRTSKVTAAALGPQEMRRRGSAGGKIGGKIRAETLSPKVRKTIAKNAIAARWAKD